MSARKKLNYTHITGAIGVAAIIGGLTGSWPVFFVTAAALLAGAVYTGDVRFTNRRR